MANITLKNIPDELYDRVKDSARCNHRSINGEIIARLETALKLRDISPEEWLERIRRARPQFDPNAVSLDELLEAIDQGRP